MRPLSEPATEFEGNLVEFDRVMGRSLRAAREEHDTFEPIGAAAFRVVARLKRKDAAE